METNIKIGNAIYSVISDDNYLDTMGNNFEPHMVQLFRALIEPTDIVADIGANIGLTALLFSSLASRIYAFEPSPTTYRILLQNLARNAANNVDVINLGLGQKEENLTLTFAKNNRSGGFVSNKISLEDCHITENIRIDTLDRFFAGKEQTPTFLKIDVEGFEKNVIEGGSGFLLAHKPTVVMEMNHFCLDVLQRITIPDFLDFMRSVFPYLYAVDTDNASIVDLHEPEQAYMVMHEHVVKNRFPNLVGGFDHKLTVKLGALETIAKTPTSALSEPKGKITASAPGTVVKAGGSFEISVSVSNESNETWHGYGKFPVHLSYHWKNSYGDFLIYDGIRTELKKPEIFPGDIIEQIIYIAIPGVPGEFKLVLTLVQEGVAWFEDRGFEPAEIDIKVL
jgi:FkbM family methyltransferase